MRFIKMTGGLGNQMFIYAFYMRMKKHYSNTRIDLSDMVHYKAHNGYEMHRVFNLPPIEFRINQPLKKVIEFLFFKKIYERKQVPSSLVPYDKKYFWPLLSSNPQLNFQQLSNNFLPCMRVLCLSFVLL